MLTFPTLAEQAVVLYQTGAIKSISVAAKRLGADKEVKRNFDGTVIIWTFDDDSSIHTKGRGNAYKYWTELP